VVLEEAEAGQDLGQESTVKAILTVRGSGKIFAALLLALALLAHAQSPDQSLEAARRLKQQGALRPALQAYEALLPDLRSAPDYPQALLELSQTALALGEYPRAIEAGAEAAAIFRQRADAANESLAANTVGLSQLNRGEYAPALESYERSLQLDRAQHDGRGEITRLSNIGNVYFFQGKYMDALQSYQLALRRVGETAAEPWNPGRRQLVLANLAILYQQLGQYQKALDYYQLALTTGAALPPNEYAQLLSNAGTIYRRLGDPVKALRTYQTAQNLFAREQLSDGQIHVLQNIGIAYALDLGDMPRALDAFARALKLAEATSNRRETVLAHLFRGEALYRMDRIAEAGRDFDLALAGARQIGAVEEQWTAQYGLGRVYRRHGQDARALDTLRQAIAGIESVRSALGAASLKTEFLANKRDVYDAAIDILLQTAAATPAQLFDLFERARSRNLQDALRNRLSLPTFAELQRRLDAHSVLIEYWICPGRVAALWIARGGSGVTTRTLTAGDTSGIRQLAAALPAARGNAEWRTQAAQIGQLLLGGIPTGPAVTHLLIVPDGMLYLLPFEALSPGASAQLVVEQFAVSYLPSAALILGTDRPVPRRAFGATWGVPAGPGSVPGFSAFPWNRQLVAFGDPLAPAGGVLADDRRWSRLPDAARELHAIAAELPGRSQIYAGSGDLKALLTAGRATAVPLLHFSTHATVDPADPNRSRMLFTPEPGNPGSEYLFWPEAAALPLSGVDLVTLSACDTEGGKMVRGEGVQSFSRAFLAAGARSTVTTLWRVADAPTADFMRLFYRHLAQGESKAAALRAAKLSFIRSGNRLAEPLYWAAFVLNGDGRAPIPRVLSWRWIAMWIAVWIPMSIAAAILAAALIRWVCRRRRYRRRPRHPLDQAPAPAEGPLH
jgi:CHAT domain-containing protein